MPQKTLTSMWGIRVPGDSDHDGAAVSSSPRQPPVPVKSMHCCMCGKGRKYFAAARRQVSDRSSSKYKGRYYYTCSANTCSYFAWADMVEGDAASTRKWEPKNPSWDSDHWRDYSDYTHPWGGRQKKK